MRCYVLTVSPKHIKSYPDKTLFHFVMQMVSNHVLNIPLNFAKDLDVSKALAEFRETISYLHWWWNHPVTVRSSVVP